MFGKSTKIEPIVNPIILKKVCVWNLSNKTLSNFIQKIEPMIRPIAKGKRKGIYNEDTETIYAL